MEPEEKKSTAKAEVIEVKLESHGNADSLSVVNVFGFTCVVRTEDWVGVKKAAWIPPDNLVDTTRSEFAFLIDKSYKDGEYAGKARIKAVRLRGVVSYGLLVPVPDDAVVGGDWSDKLGIEHYEPKIKQEGGNAYMGGEAAPGPSLVVPKYDIDAFRRYSNCFEEGEPVVVTEKIHGANARFVYTDGQFYCGSKTEWKREYPGLSYLTVENMVARSNGKLTEEEAKVIVDRIHSKPPKQNMWWKILRQYITLEKFLKEHEGYVVYGEVYGQVQDLTYGHKRDEISLALFDIRSPDGRWLDPYEARDITDDYELPWVPFVNDEDSEHGLHGFNFEHLCKLAEGPSLVPGAKNIREGVVISPVRDRYHRNVGRLKLKIVSAAYLERSK